MLSRRFSKRAEVGISISILAYAGLVIAAILTLGVDGNRSDWIATGAILLLVYFVGDLDLIRTVEMKGKLILVLGGLASAGLIIAAMVTFIRERDWPAKYLYPAAMIWLVIFNALKRLARRNQAQ